MDIKDFIDASDVVTLESSANWSDENIDDIINGHNSGAIDIYFMSPADIAVYLKAAGPTDTYTAMYQAVIFRQAALYKQLWDKIEELCDGGYHPNLVRSQELIDLCRDEKAIESRLEMMFERHAGEDFVFAYKPNAVLLVGSGEDGVYVLERPVLTPKLIDLLHI